MHDLGLELDSGLDQRLAAMESRVTVAGAPPALGATGRRSRRFALSLSAAPVLVLAIAATAGAAVVASGLARGYPGIQNDGQPMAGAHMECLTPPQAAALLAAHGFTSVTWQVESGSTAVKGEGSSTQQATPPQHGYVVPGSVLEDGSVIMVVDQRVDATGTGACPDLPMP
jgi:hypothetical protein